MRLIGFVAGLIGTSGAVLASVWIGWWALVITAAGCVVYDRSLRTPREKP